MENIDQLLEHHKAQITVAQLETYHKLNGLLGTRSITYYTINQCLYLTAENTGNIFVIYPDGESRLEREG